MSVQRVTLTFADEQYEPPTQELDVSVVDGLVYLTVYDGSDQNCPSTRKKAYEVPVIGLHDLIAALAAFGVSVQGLHRSAVAAWEADRG